MYAGGDKAKNVYIVAAGEYVGDIERLGRTIKEGSRYHMYFLPYIQYHKQIIVGYMTHVIKGLNQLSTEDGISIIVSLPTLVTGVPGPDYHQIQKLNFVDYVQSYNMKGKTNTNVPRRVGPVALYRSGSARGGWYFMSLLGRGLYRY